jgi:hypothetical protein
MLIALRGLPASEVDALIVNEGNGDISTVNHRSVWHGVYTANDALPAGQTVKLGELPAGSNADDVKTFVDYVRLANGTTWGKITTDEAKEVSARFQQQ